MNSMKMKTEIYAHPSITIHRKPGLCATWMAPLAGHHMAHAYLPGVREPLCGDQIYVTAFPVKPLMHEPFCPRCNVLLLWTWGAKELTDTE